MALPLDLLWQQLYDEKRRVVERPDGSKVVTPDFATFQLAMQTMAVDYASKGLPKFLSKLYPKLEHIKSLQAAVSSMTQANMVSTLVWGALQIFLEAACRFSSHLEDIVDYIIEFDDELPMMTRYMHLFPNQPQLHLPLSNICVAYFDYCLAAVKQLRENTIKKFARFGLSSSQQKILHKAKKELLRHRTRFFAEIQYLTTEHVEQDMVTRASVIHTQRLPQVHLTPLPSSSSSTQSMVRWPVHAIDGFVNYAFSGREDVLHDMQKVLQSPTPSPSIAGMPSISPDGPACIILHGLGGIGKTSIALKYAIDSRKVYDAIFWLPAALDSELSSVFCLKIARKLRLVEENYEHAHAIEEAKNWLEDTDKRWLIIFDNVHDINDLSAYWPKRVKPGNGIIVTSRRVQNVRVTDAPSAEIGVTDVNDQTGAEMLFKYLGRSASSDKEHATAQEISKVVGGLPLAIAAIAGYVQSNHTLEEFLASFNQSSGFWRSAKTPALGQYERTLSTVFECALHDLDDDTLQFLRTLSLLNPDGVPQELLRLKHPPDQMKIFDIDDHSGLLDMTTKLQQGQLIIRKLAADNSYSFSMHRALQWTILHDMDMALRERTFLAAITLIRQVIPEPDPLIIPEPDKWPAYEKYFSQIINVTNKAREPLPALDAENIEFAFLLSDISCYMWYQGHLADCERFVRRAEEIFDRVQYDPLSKRRWDLDLIVGILCTLTGVSRRAEGFNRRKKLLPICDRMEKDPDILPDFHETMRCISLADLAVAYLEDEQLQEVEGLMQECKVIYARLGTEKEEPFHWGRFYHHRAYLQASNGHYAEAIQMCKHAADLQEAHCGVAGTHTQEYRFTIGEMFYHAGDLKKALEIHTQVMRAREQIDGMFSPRTLTSFFVTGILQWRNGNSDQAKGTIECCFQEEYRMIWSIEQKARAQFYYSKLLELRGEQAEAARFAVAAEEVRDRLLREEPRYLRADPADERVVYDLMVPVQDLRLTGKVHGAEAPWW